MKVHRSADGIRDRTELATLRDAARLAGWGLAFWCGAQLAAAWLERNATMVVAVQAAIAEWGAGKMGIAWSDPRASPVSATLLAKRICRGAALGGAAAALVVATALSVRDAIVAPFGASVGTLALGLLVAGLRAVRDELFLRGVVLRVMRGLLPTWAVLLACGGAAAAARFGVGGGGLLALVIEGMRGVALGAVWMRDRGAWMACAANAAWAWALGSVVRGGLLDIRFAVEPDAGLPALGVATAAALVATFWVLREPAL